MNKGFIKLSILLSVILMAFVAGLALFSQPSVKSALATRTEPVVDGCDHNCPVVHFEWTTNACPTDDAAYTSNDNDKDCKRKIDGHYKYADKVSTNHSADVQYEKSQDPNKCHRPSDDDLKDEYGMNNDARHDFKDANDEWMDSVDVAPEGYYSENGACYPKTPVCADDSATNYGGEDGQFDSNKEVSNNNLCTYPEVVDVCSNIEGNQASLPEGYHYDEQENCVPNEGEPTVAPTAVPTVTPTPTAPPAGHGDGLSDGRSSCPECTQAPKVEGQVLGASTGQVLGASTMAKTGNFETKAMNLYMIFGMFLLLAGYTSYAKEKRFN